MARKATSRDPEAWARATDEAREQRLVTAAAVAEQVREHIVEGDVMGSRGLVARRIEQVLVAERTGDVVLLRSAVMDLAAASGSWVAQLDLDAPARG